MVGGMSILPTIFFYLCSIRFKFCAYHRMFLHYIVIHEAIAWYDYKIGIAITDAYYLTLHLIIAGIFLFLIIYLKFKCK